MGNRSTEHLECSGPLIRHPHHEMGRAFSSLSPGSIVLAPNLRTGGQAQSYGAEVTIVKAVILSPHYVADPLRISSIKPLVLRSWYNLKGEAQRG